MGVLKAKVMPRVLNVPDSMFDLIPKNIDDPMALVFKASMEAALKTRSKSQLNDRLSNMLQINIEKQMNKIEKSYTFLATVGSTAPFIGFQGISWGPVCDLLRWN